MIGHRIESGACATAIAFSRRDVLGPDAAFAWLSFGRHLADFALEGEDVDHGERKVPGHEADEEDGLEESRPNATANAAQSGDDKHHDGGLGVGTMDEQRATLLHSDFISCGYPSLPIGLKGNI